MPSAKEAIASGVYKRDTVSESALVTARSAVECLVVGRGTTTRFILTDRPTRVGLMRQIEAMRTDLRNDFVTPAYPSRDRVGQNRVKSLSLTSDCSDKHASPLNHCLL